MDPHTELTRRFWRMPLEATIRYAASARTFVDVVAARWAAGRFVPRRCTPQWVADLAVQADLAERVAACRLAGLPGPSQG